MGAGGWSARVQRHRRPRECVQRPASRHRVQCLGIASAQSTGMSLGSVLQGCGR